MGGLQLRAVRLALWQQRAPAGGKRGGRGGGLATGPMLGRQAFQKEWSGGSSLVHLKPPPGRGTSFPCFPGSGVGGLLADRPAGSSPFSRDKGSGCCDGVARGTDGPLGETDRVSTQLSEPQCSHLQTGDPVCPFASWRVFC